MGALHVNEASLGENGFPAFRIAKLDFAFEGSIAEVERLTDVQKSDFSEVEPFATFDTEGEGKPIGKIDEILVFDNPSCDFCFESVVTTGQIGARCVDLICTAFRGCAARRENAISECAECLVKFFLFGIKSFVSKRPRVDRGAHAQFCCEACEEIFYSFGIGESVLCKSLMCSAFYNNSDPVRRENTEGILVGDIVADIDRKGCIRVDLKDFKEPEDSFSFVPIDRWLELKNHFARCLLQIGIVRMRLFYDLFDPGTLSFGNPSAVNRTREFLSLDLTAFDRSSFFAQLFFCIDQKWEKTFNLVGFFTKSPP